MVFSQAFLHYVGELPTLSQLNCISCLSCLSLSVKEKYETTCFRNKVEFQSQNFLTNSLESSCQEIQGSDLSWKKDRLSDLMALPDLFSTVFY